MTGRDESPHFGEESGQDPEYGGRGPEETGPDEGVDTGLPNEDLHGQAREIAESAKGPGPGQTPAG
ncbi:MAG TPA: hypothetical protein VM367_04210 [Pseudonocardia sp.]|jgi:hypothetical protein|nr:hypothetical protein [Pseudonocardia sp.]